ncbi:MAG: hypothetical protein Q4A16_02020, partial [Lautropia sp.]|nr:hypothetical protein [Lautropia sp.]
KAEAVVEVEAPKARRGRKPKAEAAVEVEAPKARRGRKPKTETAAAPVTRGRRKAAAKQVDTTPVLATWPFPVGKRP